MHINSKNCLNHFRKYKTLETLWKNLNLQLFKKKTMILKVSWEVDGDFSMGWKKCIRLELK